jgi:hypothetical protein
MRQHVTVTFFAACAVGLATAGCPRVDDPGPATVQSAVVEPTQVEPAAPPIAEPVVEPAPVEPPAKPMARRAVVTSVSVARVDAEQAEDGRGATVAAEAPVAIEIAAEAWPVRAIDPVLHVGDLVFRHYTFPRLNVLRYVAADRALLPAGAAAWIQYGDDTSSRVEVAESLEVPR